MTNEEKLDAINKGDTALLESESRWTIYAWWVAKKIDREKISEAQRKAILAIVDDCKISL